jgi:hypothetical protein
LALVDGEGVATVASEKEAIGNLLRRARCQPTMSLINILEAGVVSELTLVEQSQMMKLELF